MDDSSGDYDSSGLLYPMDTTTTIHTTTTRSLTAVLPSPTLLLPEPDDDNNDKSIFIILFDAKEWVVENPIMTGLSGAVLILSILLLCMCYLWLCKRRKHILYEVVEFDDNSTATAEEGAGGDGGDGGDGEMHNNPWTEDDIDSHIVNCDDDCERTSLPAGERQFKETVQHLNKSSDKVTSELIAELKEVQTTRANNNHTETNNNNNNSSSNSSSSGSSNPVSSSSVQETTLIINEVEQQQQQKEEDGEHHDQKETVSDGVEQMYHYEEIPNLHQMTIDWPSDLTNNLTINNNYSGSLNLSDISDIA